MLDNIRSKTIKIALKKEVLWFARVLFFALAGLSMLDIYQALSSGVADTGRVERVRGEDFSFYSFLLKNAAFCLMFLWIAIVSLVEKK